jgi:hypothetical protein
MEVLAVGAEMLGQVIDPGGKNRDLAAMISGLATVDIGY